MKRVLFLMSVLLAGCGDDAPPASDPPPVEQPPLEPVPMPVPIPTPIPDPIPDPIPPPIPVPESPPPAPTCDGVKAPPPQTETVFDPNPARYAGAYCAEGETCTPVEENDPNYRLTPDGAWITYTYVGELRANEDGSSDELVMLPIEGGSPPNCWAWQWRHIP